MSSSPRRSAARPRAVRALTAAACAAILPVALAACGSSGGNAGGSGGTASSGADGGLQLVNPGKLTVCTHMAYKPFQFNKDGKIVGFDVDIVDLAAKEMGLEQQIVDIEFQQIWSGAAFKAKKCDVGAAGMTITDARKQRISFAGPYFIAGQDLLVRADNTDITGPASLNGKKLCSVTGSTSAQKVKDQFAGQVQLQELDTYSKCVEELAQHIVDSCSLFFEVESDIDRDLIVSASCCMKLSRSRTD